jgi:hypothetical protein
MFAAMVNYHFRDVPVVQLMFTPMNVIDAMQPPLKKKEKKRNLFGENKKKLTQVGTENLSSEV